jgi:methylenetetrahydrofolate reductase (NADPH)
MEVTAHLAKTKNTLVSFEILPQLEGKSITSIYDNLDPLMEFMPSWINVTYHRSEHMFKKRSNGIFEEVDVRKRKGTVSIFAAFMNHYNIDAVPHIICGGFIECVTVDALIDLQFLGIDNALILRGNSAKNESSFEPELGGNNYAVELKTSRN